MYRIIQKRTLLYQVQDEEEYVYKNIRSVLLTFIF